MVYVQGLALTYTLVGVIAGLTGALLTVWLQQPWVVLAAAALMVVLALSMFGLFSIQLPAGLTITPARAGANASIYRVQRGDQTLLIAPASPAQGASKMLKMVFLNSLTSL